MYKKTECDFPGGRDEVVAHLLLLAALLLGGRACALELCVLEDVVGAHPVQDELGLVGHPHDVVLNERDCVKGAFIYDVRKS